MKIVIPPMLIEELDGFKNDSLDRKPFGQALLNLVKRSNDELVLSLDGRWGEGKTTFIKMWQGLLADDGVPSIYIDAFQNDYVEDAFVAIASVITSYVESHCEDDGEKSEFKEKAKKVGVQLLSWSTKVAIKAATLGAIKESDLDALKDIKTDIATGVSGEIGNFIKERLSSHAKDVALIRSFKEDLSHIPAKLKGNKSNKLVIVIDELDRCKPTFAVEVLEKIKHLFSVPNIVFVLVMHRGQLEEAVRSVYGQNIDAHTYLQKFINIETSIPKRTGDNRNDLDIYNLRLFKLHELETWGDSDTMLKGMGALARYFNLSLRQLEKAYTNLAIIYSTSSKDQLRLVPIITFLSVLKVIGPDIFNQVLMRRIEYQQLLNQVVAKAVNLEGTFASHIIERTFEWLKFAMMKEEDFDNLDPADPIKRYGESLWQYDIDRGRILPLFCQQLAMFTANSR